MSEIKVRHFSGDGTGVVDVISGTRIYTHKDIVRIRMMVNFVIRTGGELILPRLTEIAAKRSPSLEIHGGVYGPRELKVYPSSRAQLHLSGHSACFNCSSKYRNGLDRKYWFEKITVKAGGTFEAISAVTNVENAVQIHSDTVAVQYNGVVLCDAMELFSKYIKVDHDARFDCSGRVSLSGSGPGQSCGRGSAGGGAGHGGNGGRGADCHCTHTYAAGKHLDVGYNDRAKYRKYFV